MSELLLLMLQVSAAVLVTIIAFYVIEKWLRRWGNTKYGRFVPYLSLLSFMTYKILVL